MPIRPAGLCELSTSAGLSSGAIEKGSKTVGMFDEVRIDEKLPDFPLECRRFQTKSLDRCMCRYLVTEEGRLCLLGSVLMDDTPVPLAGQEAGMVDTDFHGDIRLVPDEGEYEEYIMRFTHGTFEWIRPMADVPRFLRPT
jgi:hypothetical protein